MNIALGYEIGTGRRVTIPVNHTVVLGQTQLSGKTTTLEAMVTRSGLRAIGFITKPGEKSFRQQTQIPAFFSESTITDYWKYVVSIVENLMSVKLGWQERGWIVKLCQDYERAGKTEKDGYEWEQPASLRELLGNVETALPHLRGTAEMICMQLREYLKAVVREIEKTKFSSKLDLQPGINVMDVTELSDGLKALVIRSVIEQVHKHGRKTVIIIPEAWKFIPEGRSTPVKLALEGLIREGAGVGNFVWMDSQDLRGVDKLLLRSVIVWLFGVQRQKNEVASTLASIPDHPKPTATEIMQLGKGEFYVCYGSTLLRTYVQPSGMEDAHAQAIARGEESPDSWRQIAKALDEETGSHEDTEPQSQEVIQESDQRPGAEAVRSTDTPGDNDDLSDLSESRAATVSEGEDMWKEKYEELEAMHKTMIEAHDALAAEVVRLRNVITSKGSWESKASQKTYDDANKALQSPSAGGEIPPGSPPAISGENGEVRPSPASPQLNGAREEIYRYVIERAMKDPAVLAVLANRPELRVSIRRETLETDDRTMRGRMALLISEGFFEKPRDTAAVMEQCKRRGWLGNKTPLNLLDKKSALGGLVELGFLTKEGAAYQAIAGMKIHIHDAGKAVAAR